MSRNRPLPIAVLTVTLLAGCWALGCGATARSSGTTATAPVSVGTPADRTNLGSVAAAAPPAASVASPVAPGPPGGAGFGLTKQRAVNVCMPDGERRFLSSLQCPDGSTPTFARRGNVGPRNPDSGELDMTAMDPHHVIPPGTVDSHIIDVYDVQCSGGPSIEVFMDMYHCSDPDPLQPIGPLQPAPGAEAPPGSI